MAVAGVEPAIVTQVKPGTSRLPLPGTAQQEGGLPRPALPYTKEGESTSRWKASGGSDASRLHRSLYLIPVRFANGFNPSFPALGAQHPRQPPGEAIARQVGPE